MTSIGRHSPGACHIVHKEGYFVLVPLSESLASLLSLSLCLSDLSLFPLSLSSRSIEEMCAELTKAIEDGDMQAASSLAASLARQQAALRIQPSVRSCEETEIR